MKYDFTLRRSCLPVLVIAAAVYSAALDGALQAEPANKWTALFDGRSFDGWRASEHSDTWRVEDGCLVAHGQRSHLFYEGPVGNHHFRNFELEAEVCTQPDCNAGIFFHTRYQQRGWPKKGYELQINNTYRGVGNYRELKRTGSLYAVRNIYSTCVSDDEWFRVRLRVVGNRIRIWVNDYQTVDYLQPENCYRKPEHPGACFHAAPSLCKATMPAVGWPSAGWPSVSYPTTRTPSRPIENRTRDTGSRKT